MNVSTATTAELVAFYNKHANKPVNKFADRKTAERRVNALLADIKFSKPSPERTAALEAAEAPAKQAAKYVPGTCPSCGGSEGNITCGQIQHVRGHQHVVNEHQALCHSCGHEFDYNTGKPLRKAPAQSADRSAAIAASWQNKAVAARRAQRHAVRVTDPKGGQGNYKSVREAFVILALPLGQHIKFRGALKASGKADFGGFKFKLVERE